jgi:hypothetical protein
VIGKGLIPNTAYQPSQPPDQKYIYAGPSISFDPAAVFSAPPDPGSVSYPSVSLPRRAVDTFNYNYTGLLKTLHAGFNGNPTMIGGAVGAMFSLRRQALEMMSGQSTDGVATGPTFEWQPTLPG